MDNRQQYDIISVSYKEEHESFVANLKGSSIGCIIVCLLHMPAYILLLKMAQKYSKPSLSRDFLLLVFPTLLTVTVFANYNYISLIVLIVILCIRMRTPRHNHVVNEVVLGGESPVFEKPENSADNERTAKEENMHHRTNYITIYKGSTMLLTCMAILAVDFRIFPRRFGKTETFGVSLMDLGVGLFIIGSALTSKYARGVPLDSTSEYTGININAIAKLLSIQRYFPRQLPLSVSGAVVLSVGFGRLLMLKLLDYHEHVSEYGLHWNFFATLFCVWVAADFAHRCLSRRWLLWVATLLLLFYQWMLSCTKLTHFILSAPRTTLFSANREGIISLLGYIPMYLISESIAHTVLFDKGRLFSDHAVGDKGSGSISKQSSPARKRVSSSDIKTGSPPSSAAEHGNVRGHAIEYGGNGGDGDHFLLVPNSEADKQGASEGTTAVGNESNGGHSSENGIKLWNTKLMKDMAMTATALWLLWLAGSAVQPTSRRLVNLTYVVLCLFISMLLLLAFYVVDKLGDAVLHDQAGTGLLSPNINVKPVLVITLLNMSKYGLPVFLVANVLTGIVNSAMRTIYAAPAVSLTVLTVYSLIVTFLAWHGKAMYQVMFRVISILRRCRTKDNDI